MKRLLILLTALAMCLSLAACGKDTSPASPGEPESNQEQFPLTTPTVPDAPDDPKPKSEANPEVRPEPDTEPQSESAPAPETKPESDTKPESPAEEPYVRTIDAGKPMVALTFDDGPHKELTPLLLDILEENHAVATFFEVGRNVWNAPEALVRMEEMGCEIGTHSNAHKNLSKLKKATLFEDLEDADKAFISAVGHAPYLLRPPYGAVNSAVKNETGRAVITWDIDTNDWKTSDPQVVIDFIANAGNLDGKIVLLHSTHASTVEAMKTVVPQLIADGYQLVTVTELFAYYYGEVPQQNSFYGYTYFHSHSKAETPAPMPETYPEPLAPSVIPEPEVQAPAATPPSSETPPAAANPPAVEAPPAEELPPTAETEPTLPDAEAQPDRNPPADGTVPPDAAANTPA